MTAYYTVRSRWLAPDLGLASCVFSYRYESKHHFSEVTPQTVGTLSTRVSVSIQTVWRVVTLSIWGAISILNDKETINALREEGYWE
jgi:hypothetical protein